MNDLWQVVPGDWTSHQLLVWSELVVQGRIALIERCEHGNIDFHFRLRPGTAEVEWVCPGAAIGETGDPLGVRLVPHIECSICDGAHETKACPDAAVGETTFGGQSTNMEVDTSSGQTAAIGETDDERTTD